MSSDKPAQYWSTGVMECWTSDAITPSLHRSIIPATKKRRFGFALYEVLIGLTIFVFGVLALGRAVQNCLNANTLSVEEDRVREILSNRMAEIQATPGPPDVTKQFKVDSGYGPITLSQKSAPANLTEANGTKLLGVNLVTLTAEWLRAGMTQSKKIEFYVYRPG